MISTTVLASALAVAGLGGSVAASVIQGTDVSGPGTGATFIVAADGTADFRRIGAAVLAASDGDVIAVRPGTYDEAIVISKDITVMGDGPRQDIVVTTPAGPILLLDESNAVVTGLTFTGSASDGVIVSGGAPRLDGLLFRSVGVPWQPGFRCDAPCDSLRIDSGSSATVRDSSFVDGGGIWVEAASPVLDGNELIGGPALMLWSVHDGTVVHGNTIRSALGNAVSIYLGDAKAMVEGNTIIEAGASGISVGLGPVSHVDPIIRGNSISHAINGITVTTGAQPTIEDNSLFENGTAIVIANADPTISHNEIRDNGGGIFVMWGAPLLEGNTISGGRIGLGVGTPWANPILDSNIIVANEANVELMFGAAMPDTAGNQIGGFEISPARR